MNIHGKFKSDEYSMKVSVIINHCDDNKFVHTDMIYSVHDLFARDVGRLDLGNCTYPAIFNTARLQLTHYLMSLYKSTASYCSLVSIHQ